jgi:dihydrodipicolinate synthase/N-acetylneuraminate lyase
MTRIAKKYSGVIVPMVTPIDAKQNIDVDSVNGIVEVFVESGVAPFLLGTTGESFSVSETKKRQLVASTVKAVNKRCTVYAGISSNCLEEAIETGKAFADLGADVLVAHQPYYFPMNDEQLLVWFEQMANSLPVPLILYNNPITTKQSVPLSVIDKLSHHPNIVGFKDSERGMERLDEAIALWKNRADFSHLLGWAAQSAYSVLNGSDGIIPSTGNFIPSTYKTLYDAALAGNADEANRLQDVTNRISEIYQKDRYINDSIPALKGMMSLMGLCQRHVFAPMLPSSHEVLGTMNDMMKREGLVK